MASFAKKIKTKLKSSKQLHGRYSFDGSIHPGKNDVQLQRIGTKSESESMETMDSNQPVAMAMKSGKVSVNGFVSEVDMSGGDEVFKSNVTQRSVNLKRNVKRRASEPVSKTCDTSGKITLETCESSEMHAWHSSAAGDFCPFQPFCKPQSISETSSGSQPIGGSDAMNELDTSRAKGPESTTFDTVLKIVEESDLIDLESEKSLDSSPSTESSNSACLAPHSQDCGSLETLEKLATAQPEGATGGLPMLTKVEPHSQDCGPPETLEKLATARPEGATGGLPMLTKVEPKYSGKLGENKCSASNPMKGDVVQDLENNYETIFGSESSSGGKKSGITEQQNLSTQSSKTSLISKPQVDVATCKNLDTAPQDLSTSSNTIANTTGDKPLGVPEGTEGITPGQRNVLRSTPGAKNRTSSDWQGQQMQEVANQSNHSESLSTNVTGGKPDFSSSQAELKIVEDSDLDADVGHRTRSGQGSISGQVELKVIEESDLGFNPGNADIGAISNWKAAVPNSLISNRDELKGLEDSGKFEFGVMTNSVSPDSTSSPDGNLQVKDSDFVDPSLGQSVGMCSGVAALGNEMPKILNNDAVGSDISVAETRRNGCEGGGVGSTCASDLQNESSVTSDEVKESNIHAIGASGNSPQPKLSPQMKQKVPLITLSIDSEIEEIVKNYDNVMYKSGNEKSFEKIDNINNLNKNDTKKLSGLSEKDLSLIDSDLNVRVENCEKLDRSLENSPIKSGSQTDLPVIIFQMDEEKTNANSSDANPFSGNQCCCTCHQGPLQLGECCNENEVIGAVKRSCSDDPVQNLLDPTRIQNLSSLSEPSELNIVGQGEKKFDNKIVNTSDCKSCRDKSAFLSAICRKDVLKPGSCPELSMSNFDKPPTLIERRHSNDPLPPVPLRNKQNRSDTENRMSVPPCVKSCHYKLPTPSKKDSKKRTSVENETYALLKDVAVERALTTPRARQLFSSKPAKNPTSTRNVRYCDNRTYVDTCDIKIGGSTECNCVSVPRVPTRKVSDDVPPPVPKRNYSLYSNRTRPPIRTETSLSDSDSSSSSSRNSLDDLPNLNCKKLAIPNEYIDSDEFPKSPPSNMSNEDLRRWEDALSLPSCPEDPQSSSLFQIHNQICDMCRLRGQGKKQSPSKSQPGIHPVSSGGVHPLCFNRETVKVIQNSSHGDRVSRLQPNPPRSFYDSDSESDSGIGSEFPQSRSNSGGETSRLDRYNHNLLTLNPVYSRSQKARSLPQNFSNRTYISDDAFCENSEKSKNTAAGKTENHPPPIPKRNYARHAAPQGHQTNDPPPAVPRKCATLSRTAQSMSDEELTEEPIHMSLKEVQDMNIPMSDTSEWSCRHRVAMETRNPRDQRPLSCGAATQHYIHHMPPGTTFVEVNVAPCLQKRNDTDSSDEGSKDKPPAVPPREKRKNPLSALFKPKQKLGSIFHWKKQEKPMKSRSRKLPPLPTEERDDVIFCSGDQDHVDELPPGCATDELKEDDKDAHNSSNFIDSLIRLREVGWYWGPLNLEDAENKLIHKKDGSFLVRDSSHDSYILSLSFRSQGRTHHTRIEHCHGTFGFWSQPVSHGRMSIIDFIERAMEFSRNGKFLYFLRPHAPGHPPSPVALLYPISRFEVMQSLQHTCRFIILKHVRYDHIEQLPLPQPLKRYLKEKQYFTEKLDNELSDDE